MAGNREEDYDEYMELMGATDSGGSSWNADTAGRGTGSAGAATHFRPGHTAVGYPTMPVSPSDVERHLPGISGSEAMDIGQELIARRRVRGEDTAHHPGRRVDRQSFGL